jgi:hypothetical protein
VGGSISRRGDYKTFSFWAECWLKDSRKIYLNCGANYPFVGIIASAGALSTLKTLLGAEDYSQLVHPFQFYLAIFDALNFILVWLLAKALKLKYPLAISVLIAALPSSWAGGALWGQIDGVSQFFLLACVLCFVTVTQSNSDKLSLRSVTCFVLGLFALVAFVLTKQLAAFSLPAVLPLAVLACLRLWTSGTKLHGAIAAGSALLLGIAFLFFWIAVSKCPRFSSIRLSDCFTTARAIFLYGLVEGVVTTTKFRSMVSIFGHSLTGTCGRLRRNHSIACDCVTTNSA